MALNLRIQRRHADRLGYSLEQWLEFTEPQRCRILQGKDPGEKTWRQGRGHGYALRNVPYQELPLFGDPLDKECIAYLAHAQNTLTRTNWQDKTPILFKLTFNEWLDIWIASGHLKDRGRRKHQYCMSRKNDYGNYEVGNVEIVQNTENYATRTRLFWETGEGRKRLMASMPNKQPHPSSVENALAAGMTVKHWLLLSKDEKRRARDWVVRGGKEGTGMTVQRWTKLTHAEKMKLTKTGKVTPNPNREKRKKCATRP
jgi:hypothetical protein